MGLKAALRRERSISVEVGGLEITLLASTPTASDLEGFQLAIEDQSAALRVCAEVLASCVSEVVVGEDVDDDYPDHEDDREAYWLEACDATALQVLTMAVFTGGADTSGK